MEMMALVAGHVIISMDNSNRFKGNDIDGEASDDNSSRLSLYLTVITMEE